MGDREGSATPDAPASKIVWQKRLGRTLRSDRRADLSRMRIHSLSSAQEIDVADKDPPKPVQGIVIETSRGTLVLLALGLGLFGFANGFVLWDSWSHKDAGFVLPFHLAKDSLFTSFVVALCTFGGVACFIALVCRALFPKRLILGDEVLQVTRPSGTGSTVETQLPYANIAAVACERETYGFRQMRIGIDLIRPDAAGTYSRTHDFGTKDKDGRDLYLPEFLAASPEEIARLLTERCNKRSSTSAG
jgi:hypothetical protein